MSGSLESRLVLAQKYFFEAMLQGWCGNGRAVAVHKMPGYKEFVFAKDNFLVIDQYGSIGEKSTGTTSILFEDEPFWFMSYMGYYRKEDMPFLKSVLKRTYENGEFIGGRGPLTAMSGDLIYTNKPEGSFRRGHGDESICDQIGLRGGHSYWCAEVVKPQ